LIPIPLSLPSSLLSRRKKNPNPSPESTDPRPRRGPRRQRRRAPAAAGHRTTRRRPSRPGAAAGAQVWGSSRLLFSAASRTRLLFQQFWSANQLFRFRLAIRDNIELSVRNHSLISYVGCLVVSLYP
jgi:hypothetical protein